MMFTPEFIESLKTIAKRDTYTDCCKDFDPHLHVQLMGGDGYIAGYEDGETQLARKVLLLLWIDY